MAQAYFGKPSKTFVSGGAHVAVYLVPVYEGRLVVFDVAASAARGRWLPWDILEFGGNPYEAAAALADDWCDGAVSDLTLADAMSFPFEEGSWELALVFRAELTAIPAGDAARSTFVYDPGEFDAIGNFDPVDLERWALRGLPAPEAPPGGGVSDNLVF
ncbi:MAG: hypothetical protein IPI33_10555 [Dehalococcoidia bacterium]|uniref:hypothetical protein n=1 Tax=Candidatus Amarobacter glycogenicus TaxID=3140699 RepID=UPI001D6CFDD0|nr:hypothetical protein [Dehalococcoidia bacterium]MBK7725648.1 hypothetical protein [Dehalococcoidia bacterium]